MNLKPLFLPLSLGCSDTLSPLFLFFCIRYAAIQNLHRVVGLAMAMCVRDKGLFVK